MQRVFRRDATVEVLHGLTVKDPYRWLENPNAQETKDFVAAQNVSFNSFIRPSGLKANLLKSLTHLYNYEKYAHAIAVAILYCSMTPGRLI